MIAVLKRPTWYVGGEIHPAPFHASLLEFAACFRAALDISSGAYRMNDVTTVINAALCFAAETMRDALAELAFLARDAGPDRLLVQRRLCFQ